MLLTAVVREAVSATWLRGSSVSHRELIPEQVCPGRVHWTLRLKYVRSTTPTKTQNAVIDVQKVPENKCLNNSSPALSHFNVSLMDALRVLLKTIQERIGQALTASFTSDVYGGAPEFGHSIEAGRFVGGDRSSD